MQHNNYINMRQVTLNIPEKEFRFFMKMISNFAFVEVAKEEKKINLKKTEENLTPAKLKIWNDIKDGLEEVKLIELGKKKAKTAKEFINEL